jgi:hypothetical protein
VRRAAILVCFLLAGCAGISAPTSTTTTRPSKLAQAQRTHEYPASSVPAQRASRSAPSAVAAIRAFAAAYINWNAQTVTRDMRALSAQSIGQARSVVQLAAADTAQDYELRRGGIANSGTVEAIAPLRGRDRYVVVTLERTASTKTSAYAGLGPAWHVALATVAREASGRYVISGWQPEN